MASFSTTVSSRLAYYYLIFHIVTVWDTAYQRAVKIHIDRKVLYSTLFVAIRTTAAKQ